MIPSSPLGSDGGDDDDVEVQLYRKMQESKSPKKCAKASDAEPSFSLKELKTMKYVFDDYPEGMEMDLFVRLVGPEFFRLSPTATNRDIELLFKRIDANANGSVDWDEFSAFLLMNDVKATLKLTAEAKSKDFALKPTSRESQMRGHHALRHVFHKEPVHRILVHSKYPKYFSASDDGMIKVWNAETLRHVQTLQAASHAAVSDLVMTPWFDTIAATAMDNTISFYSCDSGDLVRCYKGERGGRVGGRLRGGELLFDDRPAVVRRPQFAIPVNREEGEDIKYGRSAHLFGKVDTAVPVLEHFKKPRDVPAVTLSHFGSATEGRHHVPVQAGYPTALNVCNMGGEMQMLVGFDNGYMQWYPLTGGSQGPANTAGTAGSDHQSSGAVYEEPKNTIKMHWDYISKLIAVPQMDLMLSSSFDGMIQVRPFDRMEEVTTLLGEGVVVNDYKSGSVGSSSSVVRDTGLYGHAHRVTGMDWNYETRVIVSCAPERDALIWSPYIPKPVTRLVHPKGTVRNVQFMKSSDQILTLSTDNVVRLWDVRTYRCVQALEDNQSGEVLSCAHFDSRRECVILGSQCLRRWGLVQTTEYHRKYSGHRRPVVGLVVSLPFRQVITADHKMIVVWNMDNQDAVMRWEVDGSIADICLDSNCRRLLVATLKGPILVYNYVNGLLLKTYNAGGVVELQTHFGLTHKTAPTSASADASTAPKFLTSGDPEVVAVRFADVSKPRPTSVVLSTLDDGLTAVYLDEEGGEAAPFRTLRVNSASLTSHVDSGYSLLILGHHAGISVCSLDEATTTVTPAVRLSKEVARNCKVALFVGALSDEPILATSRYLQNRDEMVLYGAQQRPSLRPGESSSSSAMVPTTAQGSVPSTSSSPFKRRATLQSMSQSHAASSRRRSTLARVVDETLAVVAAAPPCVDGDTFTTDLNQRHLQSLGLVEKILVLSSVEPHIIFTGSSDGLLQLWDGRALTELLRFRATPVIDAITALCFNHTEDALLVGDNSGYLSIFDISSLLEESADRQESMIGLSVASGNAPLAPPIIRHEMIQLKVRFRAHNETLSSIGLDEGIIPNAVIPGFNRRKSAATSVGFAKPMSQHEQRLEQQRAMSETNAFGSFEKVDAFMLSPQPRRERKLSEAPSARRHSLFLSGGREDSSAHPPKSSSPNSKANMQAAADAVITPDGLYAKLYTSSTDSYSYVWTMNRRSCEVQLVACLGDPVFKPTLPRHHPQVLFVFDTARARLIHRYMCAEGKSTWAMILAHFARVVEARRVSLFSANDAGPNVSIPYLHSMEVMDVDDDIDPLASDDSDGANDEETDDSRDDIFMLNARQSTDTSDGPFESSALSMKSVPSKKLPTFDRVNTAKMLSTRALTSSVGSRSKPLERSGGGRQGGPQMTGRRLLKDVPYQKLCRRAFDPTTHDDAGLEALLRRILGIMVHGSGGHELMANVDSEGFYYAVGISVDTNPAAQPHSAESDSLDRTGTKRNSQRVSTVTMATPDKHTMSTTRSCIHQHKSPFNVPSTPPPAAGSISQHAMRAHVSMHGGGVSMIDDSALTFEVSDKNEIVEIVRPPRHQVRYDDTSAVRDPPDISEVLSSNTAAKTTLVGPASKFTGVKSVNRNSEIHPFVSTEMLSKRGEDAFGAPDGASPEVPPATTQQQSSGASANVVSPRFVAPSGVKAAAFVPISLPLKLPEVQLPSGQSTPRDKKFFLTETDDRHAFMKSVLSYNSSLNGPSTTPGSSSGRRGQSTSPRLPSRGLALLYNDAAFVLPTPPTLALDNVTPEFDQSTGKGSRSEPCPALPTPDHDASGGLAGMPPMCDSIPRLVSSAPTGGLSSGLHSGKNAQECRSECELLDILVQCAQQERDQVMASSRRLHHGSRPTWEASDFFQRRLRRQGQDGATSGTYVLVHGEEQQKLRQLRSIAGGRHRGPNRRGIQIAQTQADKDKAQQAHLDHFHRRAVVLVGQETVSQRTLALDSEPSVASRVPKTDDGRRVPSLTVDDGCEVLGDLQWVSRLHSRLDVPRTFELIPMPPSLDAARSAENQRLKLLKETDADHVWIRMLSTARGKKAEATVRTKRAGARRASTARSSSPSGSVGSDSQQQQQQQQKREPKGRDSISPRKPKPPAAPQGPNTS